jgi:hypothetical protein
MSDEGKVLRSTNGSFLRSPDGKIVLADDLYPMVPTQQSVIYYRESNRYDSVCAATEVWGVDWSILVPGSLKTFASKNYRSSSTWTTTAQSLLQTKFVGNNIDWPRVKKLTQRIFIYAYDFSGSVGSGRVTVSQDNDVLPVSDAIRDTWDTQFAYSSSGFQGWVTVEWEINGVEPDSVECAVMFDNATCATSNYAGRIDSNQNVPGPVRVVYNLAS